MKLSTLTGKLLVSVLKRLGKTKKARRKRKTEVRKPGWEPRLGNSYVEYSSSSYSAESSESELSSEDSEA